MVHGLLWLPLLSVFGALAWLGWKEFQTVEQYRIWASGFEVAKYDVYGVLGLKKGILTWGCPRRQGPVEQGQVCLAEVQRIDLVVDGQHYSWPPASPPGAGRQMALELWPQNVRLRFSQLELALAWWQKLIQTQTQSPTNPVPD